jgi:hypothetical protein
MYRSMLHSRSLATSYNAPFWPCSLCHRHALPKRIACAAQKQGKKGGKGPKESGLAKLMKTKLEAEKSLLPQDEDGNVLSYVQLAKKEQFGSPDMMMYVMVLLQSYYKATGRQG